MQALLRLSKCIDGFNERIGWIADWMVLLSCSVSALNAAVRYAFNYSSNS
jgi:TRAP-type mannitol/chloroaromatic compound transport system permease small subunit